MRGTPPRFLSCSRTLRRCSTILTFCKGVPVYFRDWGSAERRTRKLIHSHARRWKGNQDQQGSPKRAQILPPLNHEGILPNLTGLETSRNLTRGFANLPIQRDPASTQLAIDPFKTLRVDERRNSYYILSQCKSYLGSCYSLPCHPVYQTLRPSFLTHKDA
jgi:hypothetical protein